MKPLAKVIILATGGTIAGSAPSATQPGYTSGKIDIKGMIQAVPNLEMLARVEGEQISNVGSQDMSFKIMITLAQKINELLSRQDIHGVVVTHGTDTMEETAFFLNLTINSRKPVVMTGAMRPFTALSADGPLNMYNAVAVAAHPESRGKGVMVVMNDRIHGAHSLTKTNTTSVETFLSPINGIMGTVIYGSIQYYRDPFRHHTHLSEFTLEGITLERSALERSACLPRVDIMYACADMPPDLIDCSVRNGAKGIVIAGHGNGNMNEATLKTAARMASQGIFIVRSSRVPTGMVGRNVEVDDDTNQFIASDELNPAKARILLMLALLRDRSFQEVQTLFYTY